MINFQIYHSCLKTKLPTANCLFTTTVADQRLWFIWLLSLSRCISETIHLAIFPRVSISIAQCKNKPRRFKTNSNTLYDRCAILVLKSQFGAVQKKHTFHAVLHNVLQRARTNCRYSRSRYVHVRRLLVVVHTNNNIILEFPNKILVLIPLGSETIELAKYKFVCNAEKLKTGHLSDLSSFVRIAKTTARGIVVPMQYAFGGHIYPELWCWFKKRGTAHRNDAIMYLFALLHTYCVGCKNEFSV